MLSPKISATDKSWAGDEINNRDIIPKKTRALFIEIPVLYINR
jgi:hypothetical protein